MLDGAVPLYVVFNAIGEMEAAFDCIESAQLFANDTFGPWFPGSTWDVVATSPINGYVKMVRTLHDKDGPGEEGMDIAIVSVPAFLKEP